MLKHIWKLQNKHVFPSSRSNYQTHLSILRKTVNFKPNLKNSNVTNLHTSVSNNAKLFYDYENNFAFNIINKQSLLSNIHGVKGPSEDVKTLEEFNSVLNQDWRDSSVTEIVKSFKRVKNFCIQNNIMISDCRFNNLVDGLMDHCEKLADDELYDLLCCLTQYPPCNSFDSHNFHDVWSCLDDICCCKMVDWNLEKMFKFANIWYKLGLGKMCDFIFVLIDRLAKNAEKLTKDQLLNVFFYFNICRKRAVDFQYEYALDQQIRKMDVDEMAVVAMGYFKTRTRIKLESILYAMVVKVNESYKDIHEISLTAILKILRLSKPTKMIPQIHTMLDNLHGEMDRLSNICCLHIALISTGLQLPHNKTLQKTSEKLVKDIRNTEQVRLKDIERILNVLTMFDFDPKTEPDIYRAAYDELHKEERLREFIIYPRCLPCALNYLSLRNIYSHELMNKVLDLDYINDTYGKGAKLLPRELFSLDICIDIEVPGYKGNRLPPPLKYKAAKWLTDFTPTYDQPKKITASDQVVLDTISAVKELVKDDNFIYIDHVLPHFSRADIILCKNSHTGKFVQPLGFENYILGDVMFPINDGSLEWFAIVILGWNNTIRDSGLPLGHMIMKKRQLEKVGYKPIFVIWNEFMRITKEEQIEYISRKLS